RETHEHIGSLFADQEFRHRRRRGVEVVDRADLTLAHDTERRQHGRKHGQEDHDQAWREGEYAAEILVVAKARLDVHGYKIGNFAKPAPRHVAYIGEHDPIDVVAHRLGAERHRTVQKEGHLRPPPEQQVAAEAWRDADRHAHIARAQAAVDLRFAAQRRPLAEIARAGEALDQLPAV